MKIQFQYTNFLYIFLYILQYTKATTICIIRIDFKYIGVRVTYYIMHIFYMYLVNLFKLILNFL